MRKEHVRVARTYKDTKYYSLEDLSSEALSAGYFY